MMTNKSEEPLKVRAKDKRVFDLVMQNGTSKSPFCTRSSTTYYCSGRPGHWHCAITSQARYRSVASSRMTGRRVWMPTLLPLWRKARRVRSAASRLPESTSLHFVLHGWQRLKLYGILAHWDEIHQPGWIEPLIQWEEQERARRGLERRMKSARLGRFKPLADFNWSWPEQCDREMVNDLMQLKFINQATNVILVGPNGVGKSTIARNIAHQAVLQGHNVLFTSASQMLNELASQDGDSALKRRLAQYARPHLLVIDEVGYLSYSNRHADLLFEIVSRRYEERSTMITTNRPFQEWSEVFPNAACVVSLVDRLVHHSEIITIEGESYRLKEAKEHRQRQAINRKRRKATSKKRHTS